MTRLAGTLARGASGIAGLLVFALPLVAAVAARPQSGTLVIADFDGDKVQTRSGLLLFTIADDQFGGTSETQLSLIHPGANRSRGALRIALRVTNDFPAPFAGGWAMVGAEGLATDLSGYRGVRFQVRSKDGGAFIAGIVRYANGTRRYLAPFEAGPEWALVELPFDTFRLDTPAGTPTANASGLVPTEVTAIGFASPPRRRGQFELDVDQMELYR